MKPEAKAARQLERGEAALRALDECGNPKRAAASLNIAETTLRDRIAVYCALRGFEHPVQAAFAVAREANEAQIGGKAA